MLHINSILYPTDFSTAAGHALPFAVALAEQFDAELHMFHALVLHADDPGNISHRFPDVTQLYESLHQSAEEQLGATAAAHAMDGLKVHRAQERGISAPGAILDYIAEHDIDLVVMGTHGRRGLRRLLLGSVAEEMVRLAPCPVLTVPEHSKTAAETRIERILVPIDFSQYSKLALQYALNFARLHKARLQLLHVIEEAVYPDFYLPLMPSGTMVTEKLREQAEDRLKALLAEMEVPATMGVGHVKEGRAVTEITEFAERENSDLIVIASHGLTGLSHILLGSVTEHVVRQAACPVLTLKTFAKRIVV